MTAFAPSVGVLALALGIGLDAIPNPHGARAVRRSVENDTPDDDAVAIFGMRRRVLQTHDAGIGSKPLVGRAKGVNQCAAGPCSGRRAPAMRSARAIAREDGLDGLQRDDTKLEALSTMRETGDSENCANGRQLEPAHAVWTQCATDESPSPGSRTRDGSSSDGGAAGGHPRARELARFQVWCTSRSRRDASEPRPERASSAGTEER